MHTPHGTPLRDHIASQSPSSAVCPAHHERNQADGFTYERSAIEQWLETHNTSPATGVELDSKQLNPNHSIRSLIREFREAGA